MWHPGRCVPLRTVLAVIFLVMHACQCQGRASLVPSQRHGHWVALNVPHRSKHVSILLPPHAMIPRGGGGGGGNDTNNALQRYDSNAAPTSTADARSSFKLLAKAIVVGSFTCLYFGQLLIPVSLKLLERNIYQSLDHKEHVGVFLAAALIYFHVQLLLLNFFFLW